MPYQPLREILSALDVQQRQELAALSGQVDDANLHRAKHAKKQLATVAVFFIERSWEVLAPQIEAFSLEAECGKTTEEIRTYLETLRQRHPAYAWGWLRARMNTRLMQWLDTCVPDLLRQHPEMAARYLKCLRQVDLYWFRETPMHHLKAGYHTALGVACKWYGSACELREGTPPSGPHAAFHFQEELRLFASFSMTMLARTDHYLWDSAAAEPLQAVVEEGTLKIAPKAMEELSLESAPDYGVRLGCPALRARAEAGQPAFVGVIEWVEQIFSHSLLEACDL